jgi:hypothetical protein
MEKYVLTTIAHYISVLYQLLLPVSLYTGYAAALLFVLSAARELRRWTGTLILVITAIWGLEIWLYSGTVLYRLWHERGLLVGLCLFVIGVVPVALVATIVKAHWLELGYLCLYIFVFFVVRMVASNIETSGKRILEPPMSQAKRRGSGA